MRDRSLRVFAAVSMVVALGALSAQADAHRIGLSQGEYSLSGHHVAIRLVFAASELAPQGGAFRSKVVDRTVVSHGNERCTRTSNSVAESAEDGLAIAAEYDCARGSGDVQVDLGFLSDLEQGHRHIARVSGTHGQSEVVAYQGNSRLSLGGVAVASARSAAVEYSKLGVTHILSGVDHLLFLVGVVLLPASLRSLLLSVTAFTIAHSLRRSVSFA